MPKVRCFFQLFLLIPEFLFLSGPICNVSVGGCMALMLWEGSFQCLFLFQITWFCLCHHCFWILCPHIFHIVCRRLVESWGICLCPLIKLSCALGLPLGISGSHPPLCMNGFLKNSLIFFWHFLSGIQFLGESLSNYSMVQISKTSPSVQSFSAKATT